MAEQTATISVKPAQRRPVHRYRRKHGFRDTQALIRTTVHEANQQECPVKTGRLRRSLRIQRRTLMRHDLTWTAPYASFVQTRGKSAGYVERVENKFHELLPGKVS